MNVLVINAGSSSLKYQLMNPDTGAVSAKGLCERIGIDGKFTYKAGGKTVIDAQDVAMPTHAEAIEAVLAALVNPEYGVVKSMDEIDAVGHRVVHGGMEFAESCLIDDACIAAIEKCIPLGPLHNPANLLGIRACQKIMPNKPQVAVFDTAFHMSMPAKAYTYAIPYEYFEKDSVRRYGFHGTSHRYVSARAIDMLGNPAHSKIICCHLGNGSSLSACVDGKVVDTTMGLGPLSGVPMGTRCGDIDATILEYLMGRYGYDIKEMMNILNKKSGVLGISGVSSDFRDLEAAANQGSGPLWRWTSSSMRSKSPSAHTLPPWVVWTPSSLPQASAKTASATGPRLWRAWNSWAPRLTRRRTTPGAWKRKSLPAIPRSRSLSSPPTKS